MSIPFVVFGLPRSRTFWLARLLRCAHEQARFVRSAEDVLSWLSLGWGSVETAAAPWWRLARHYRTDLKMAVVRRDRRAVLTSLMRFGVFDRDRLEPVLLRLDRALDRAAEAPGCLSVSFEDLAGEAACARLYEHCLDAQLDPRWWNELAGQNLQADLLALIRYTNANAAQLGRAAQQCAGAQRRICLRPAAPIPDDDGIVIGAESWAQYWRDGQDLMAAHGLAVGHDADHFKRMNLPLWDKMMSAGTGVIITARLNNRMLGYVTGMLTTSLDVGSGTLLTQLTFYVTPNAPGLNLAWRLQRKMIAHARSRGATKMYMRAGILGDGPRFGALYKRMGATNFGQLYELDLAT